MFKDDKMISFLTAIVLMVAVGTVIQKVDLSGEGGEGRGGSVTPMLMLADDTVTVAVDAVVPLDVLANDSGLQPVQRAGLSIVRAPDCGRISVLGETLKYMADAGCEGERRIVYTVPEAGEGNTATVFITVIPRHVPAEEVVAQTSPVKADRQEVAPANPVVLSKATEPELEVAALAPQPQVVVEPDTSTRVEPKAEVRQQEQALAEPVELSATAPESQPKPVATDPVARDVPGLLAALGLPNLQSDDLDVGALQADTTVAEHVGPPEAQAPADDVPTHETGILLAIVGLKEPPTGNPDVPLGDLAAVEEAGPNLVRTARLGDSAVDHRSVGAFDGIGASSPALGLPLADLPVDLTQPPLEKAPESSPQPPPRADVETTLARAEPAEKLIPGLAVPNAAEGAAKAEKPVSPAKVAPGCQTPPSTAIDVMRAGRTRLSVAAPCHAGTTAELTYSGIRFAVPLDEAGVGEIMTLGLEPNVDALLRFTDGVEIDFDLPFKGMNRVSRVAMVWDMPVNLELNALEFGASPGTEQHVRPENPRTFRDVRRRGGGFLHSFRSTGGAGQNVDIYSHYKRAGGAQGVVRMMIDFASRNRERLDGTCGDGALAAPQFLVIRSDSGQVERPILRRLASLDCSEVARETGDKRLISEGIADLLIQ